MSGISMLCPSPPNRVISPFPLWSFQIDQPSPLIILSWRKISTVSRWVEEDERNDERIQPQGAFIFGNASFMVVEVVKQLRAEQRRSRGFFRRDRCWEMRTAHGLAGFEGAFES